MLTEAMMTGSPGIPTSQRATSCCRPTTTTTQLVCVCVCVCACVRAYNSNNKSSAPDPEFLGMQERIIEGTSELCMHVICMAILLANKCEIRDAL